MKKFQCTGIVLIDCWGGDWWVQQHPNFLNFYSQLEQFIIGNIEYQYVISSTTDLANNLKLLPGTHAVCQEWKDLEIFLGPVTGNWLIAGQAWDICIHHSPIGLLSLLERNYNNFIMFSHPNLISTESPHIKTTDKIFLNDKK